MPIHSVYQQSISSAFLYYPQQHQQIYTINMSPIMYYSDYITVLITVYPFILYSSIISITYIPVKKLIEAAMLFLILLSSFVSQYKRI